MRKRARGRDQVGGELMLAALIDMLVNILIFLLHLYGSDPGTTSKTDIELAASTSLDPVGSRVVVEVSQDSVTVDGTPVATLEDIERDPAFLREVLKRQWDEARAKATETPDAPKTPELVLEVDRRVPWTSLRPVLKTAGGVGFVDLRFVVSSVAEHPTAPR